MELHGEQLIGNDTSAERKRTFTALNPANDATLTPAFHQASEGEIDRALSLAESAAHELADLTPAELAGFLEAIAAQIEEIGDELTARATAETGLPAARLTGERGRTVNQLRLFAGVVREGSWVAARIDTAQPDRKPLPKPDVRQQLQPLGPVVIFGASNFPLAFSVAGGDTASALAAGNPVVVKAHPAHPGTSELVGRAVLAAAAQTGMPNGIFSLVHGHSPDVGLALVEHPITRAVGFTGSLAGGRALFDAAATRPEPIPVFAEMGSVNPIFILPQAAAERGPALAAGLHQSVTLGVGQFCTNPGLIFVPADAAGDRLIEHFGELLSDTAPGVMLHRRICEAYVAGAAERRHLSGVSVAGEAAADRGPTTAAALALVTDAETFLEHPLLQEELFGPATLLIRCRGNDEMLTAAQQLAGQLTASVHGTTADLAAAGVLLAALRGRVGRLIFNGYPTGVEVCPSMHHGGPYPATTDVRTTSVGTAAISRFARPLCWQDCPQDLLPAALQDDNPLGIWRLVNGQFSRSAVADC